MDGEFAMEQYGLYRKHFLVSPLGFNAFREYSSGADGTSDIDSGPIVMGAGATATAVGLAASVSNGDLETAEDIYDLVNSLGLRREINLESVSGTRYLLGRLPIVDAFLTWAFTLPMPDSCLTAPRSLPAQIWARRTPVAIFVLLSAAFFWYVYRFARMVKRGRQEEGRIPTTGPCRSEDPIVNQL